MVYEFLQSLPLLSAFAWVILSVALGNRPPFNTFSGRFFVMCCLALSAYALFDWLCVVSHPPNENLLLLRLSYISVTFAPTFLYLYVKGMVGQRTTKDYTVVAVSLLTVPLILGPMVTSEVTTATGVYHAVDPVLYLLWLSWMVALALAIFYYLVRQGDQLGGSWGDRKGPLRVFHGSLLSILTVGLLANILEQGANVAVPSLLSSFLLVPAVALMVLFLRESGESFAGMIASLRGETYKVLHGLLVFRGGKLIASTSRDRGTSVDEDVMMGMLDAIRSFLGQSFPFVEDGNLKVIEQADVRLLVEKGRFCYLVLVVQGREDELLRGLMVEAVKRFEIENFDFLTDWRGDVSELPDCSGVFQQFFPSSSPG